MKRRPKWFRTSVLLIVAMLTAHLAEADDLDLVFKLKRLGAICFFARDETGLFDGRVVIEVVITERWTGGDEGLQLIKELKMVRNLRLQGYPSVSQDAIAKLRKEFRQIDITRHSGAVFGMAIRTTPTGCKVRWVGEGTPAGKAGLEVGDMIVTFAGSPILDAGTLIAVMLPLKPGDRVACVPPRREGIHGRGRTRRAGRSLSS